MRGASSHDPIVGDEAVVMKTLLDEVLRRELDPGAKLPTERELAVRTGTGRAAVRRALGRLEAEGRIVRHVGRGTFLVPRTPDSVSLAAGYLADASSPSEIMAVRMIFEPQMVRMAVAAARAPDILEIERALEGGEEADTYSEFELWDLAFHRSLALATHNTLLVGVNQLLTHARSRPLWGTMKERASTPARRSIYRSQHRVIADAVRERDSDRAQTAMREHLEEVSGHLLGERELTTRAKSGP